VEGKMRIAAITLVAIASSLIFAGCQPAMYDIRECTDGGWVNNPMTSCKAAGDDCSVLAYQDTFDSTRPLLNTCSDKNPEYTCGVCVKTESGKLGCAPVFAQTTKSQQWAKPNSCVITFSCTYGPSNIDSCWANCDWSEVPPSGSSAPAVIPYDKNLAGYDQYICNFQAL
jgi:hypothetical protein